METRSKEKRNEGLIDIGQVAAMLKCSERHIRRMAERGALPQPVRLGSLLRWNEKEISEWIADGCPDSKLENEGE